MIIELEFKGISSCKLFGFSITIITKVSNCDLNHNGLWLESLKMEVFITLLNQFAENLNPH
jgi:hypothetical protein